MKIFAVFDKKIEHFEFVFINTIFNYTCSGSEMMPFI